MFAIFNKKRDEERKQYRQWLVDTQRKLNENYDKLLVTLSSGAVGLSVIFLKDVIGSKTITYPCLIFVAWVAFVISLAAILGELLYGIRAYKKAIQQVDEGTIDEQKAGGKAAFWSRQFQWIASVSLVFGLLFTLIFAFYNLGGS